MKSIPVKNRVGDKKLKTNLLVEVHRPVAESDAITEAVLAGGTAQLPIQPDVLSFGVGVKAGWLHTDTDRRGGRSSLHTCPIVRQDVVLPAGHRAWLQSRICGYKNFRGTVSEEKAINDSTWSIKLESKVCERQVCFCVTQVKPAILAGPAVGKRGKRISTQ